MEITNIEIYNVDDNDVLAIAENGILNIKFDVFWSWKIIIDKLLINNTNYTILDLFTDEYINKLRINFISDFKQLSCGSKLFITELTYNSTFTECSCNICGSGELK
jgi:hypothetical protein